MRNGAVFDKRQCTQHGVSLSVFFHTLPPAPLDPISLNTLARTTSPRL